MYVDEFVEVKSVYLTVFTSNLVSLDKLPIANVLYRFDKEDVTVVSLEHNNTIYLVDNMIDSLTNPIHCDDDDMRFDIVPKVYYPNNNNSHSFTFPYGTSIPVG